MKRPFDMQHWLYKQWKISKGINEDKQPLTEEYIEIMRDLDDGLALIKDSWLDWKKGPATEKHDIRPAQKELLNYVNSWLKKNIK